MRKLFPSYHELTDNELKMLWDDGLIIFDASILLNLYTYPKETATDFLSVLGDKSLNARIWIPYQAAFEYNKNRVRVIMEQQSSYKKLNDQLQNSLSTLEKDLRKNYNMHVLINVDEIIQTIKLAFESAKKQINKQKPKHPKFVDHDPLFLEISKVFEGKIGTKFSIEVLREIYLEGKTRYDQKIPPGFEDRPPEKQEPHCYGDLVIWKEIIQKAKHSQSKGIIFITDDNTEDWWNKSNWWDKPVESKNPRPELGLELFEETGALFHAYNSSRFLEYAKEHIDLQRKIKQKSIDAIKLRSEYMSKILVQNTIFELTKSLNLPSIAQQLQKLIDENDQLKRTTFEELRRSLSSLPSPSNGIAEALQAYKLTLNSLLPITNSTEDEKN
jgi:PIN like domain